VEAMFPFVAAVSEPIQQDHYFQALAAHVGVAGEVLRASVARFATQTGRRRQSNPGRIPGPTSSVPAATPSAFARLDRDPIEEYCLALVLQHPELLETEVDLRPEYFHRMENREIYHRLLLEAPARPGEAVTHQLQQAVGPELTEHLATLLNKELPPLEHHRRAAALQNTAHRLEERYLRELKVEEGIRFSEETADLLEEPHQEVVDLNHRIKTNENARNWIVRGAP